VHEGICVGRFGAYEQWMVWLQSGCIAPHPQDALRTTCGLHAREQIGDTTVTGRWQHTSSWGFGKPSHHLNRRLVFSTR